MGQGMAVLKGKLIFSAQYSDEDDDEYSDLDLDFEDAVERGYEDDKDRDDDRFKFGSLGSFSGRSGSGVVDGDGICSRRYECHCSGATLSRAASS